MPCQNMGVEDVEEKVIECGPNSKCGPIREAAFQQSCPAYTITVPFHHKIVKKEGYKLKESTAKVKVMKQKVKCAIKSGTIEDGPAHGETFYIGVCEADGAAVLVREISDPQDELCQSNEVDR
jgi:hypothetical protein